MTRPYEVTPLVRLMNGIGRFFIQRGKGPKNHTLLGVQGRKTGKRYTTPVSLVPRDGQRFLVAPYGAVNWVRNARAGGQVTLERGGRQETVRLYELSAAESAPILQAYLAMEPVTRPYFNCGPDAPLAAFEQEAADHPVFRLESA